MWIVAALLGHDFVDPKQLNELHHILLLWNRNFSQPSTHRRSSKRKSNKKGSGSRKISSLKNNPGGKPVEPPTAGESVMRILQHARAKRSMEPSFAETSQETLKIVLKLMTRTRLLHSAGGSLSVGGVEMSVLSCLLDISPNQVQTIFVRDLENREEVAFSKDPCCLESPACLDDDWTLDLPATPIQKWKASTSELLRIIDYFRDTREVYRLVDEDQESKISKMSSQLSYLHFDLRQVLETKIFLPRLSIAENKPCREFKIAGGMYSKFRHIRKNTYHLLFRSSQMEEPVVHVTELIFKKGMLQSFEANTCCQQEGSCWKPLSKTFWEHISFQLGRQMNPLSSVPSDLPLNGQDDELVSWVSIFSSLLLEGLTEDESPPSSNSLVIVISAVFTMTLVSTWPDVFVEERQANSHVCPVILNIWSAVEIAFQHAEYVVSAANFLDPSGSSHVSCLPVKYLNLPLFVNIHSICSEQDVTPLFLHAKKAPPPLLSLMMQSIFSRYHLTDTHQQNEILELCHGIVQLITSHL